MTKLENGLTKKINLYTFGGVFSLMFVIPMCLLLQSLLKTISTLNYPTPDGWALVGIMLLFISFLIFYGVTLIKWGFDK